MKAAKAASFLVLCTLLCPLAAWAQTGGLPMVTSTPGAAGSQTYTLSIQSLLTLTALTFIPAALLMMTSFTRIIIVLSLLRAALGTQNSPPNQVLLGLSLFLTFFIMSPVLDTIYTEAYLPLSEDRITYIQAVERGAVPLRKFMLKQTREADIALFARMAASPKFQSTDDIPMRLLIPAFVTSELKTAFQIGFIIFIPFLIVDMVVASALMSMGMMMMSPVMVALPFKLMLFVLVDGWNLLLGSLVASFAA
ncbi:MAG: flagellar type III secretion system pore protein FliP [Candidatus Accumulibacter sp.]|jgi:flagellar biosynthetic protein FliP|uniref:flagellar type III secretion system pore protein FliP n=1 Tax=Candidatus Accumulibacter TaxID=327159 RepID=UPI001AD2E8A1|nr:flagellar type III secretion system pore protein FliP [Accumulibacter sp.]MBK8114097.1 flagellar type III secretion system pore protein FliP [Accumulibacter sp.]MBK8384419.1 flagellar type III secretion system pore protein FliP [Accumulibacter sp.]MBK8577281.1 flagellar type III secretion system pore protein FliP [Candidatus Accumulibacter propinquus]MBN8439914.1 flagellar type III secretion system pore protein FliP [Accumulibacter sp.]